MASPITLSLFVFVGLCIGMLGAGGGILTVPILVHLAGIEAREAVPLSLAIVGLASGVGAALSLGRGTLAPSRALLVGAPGIAGAQVGAALTARVPQPVLLTIFALVMSVAGIAMWHRSRSGPGADPAPRPSAPRAGARAPAGRASLIAAGLAIGFLTGFLGVSGGFLIVPVLVMAGGLDMHRAAATSLAVSAINCAAGLFAHARGERIDLAGSLPYLGITLPGMLAGMAAAHRLSARRLQQAFAVLVLAVALTIAAVNVRALARGGADTAPTPISSDER